MALAHKIPLIGIAENLELEKDGTVGHEYVDGRVFAMSGSSLRHSLIVGNISRQLGDRLQDSHCSVFSTDVKVQTSPTAYYYPDVVVTCSPITQSEYVCPDPIFLLEVLLPTTEQIDRREKLLAYQRISTLREYILVAQDQLSVEVCRQQEDGVWEHQKFTQEGELHLNSLNLDLGFVDVYRGVSFEV